MIVKGDFYEASCFCVGPKLWMNMKGVEEMSLSLSENSFNESSPAAAVTHKLNL